MVASKNNNKYIYGLDKLHKFCTQMRPDISQRFLRSGCDEKLPVHFFSMKQAMFRKKDANLTDISIIPILQSLFFAAIVEMAMPGKQVAVNFHQLYP